MTIIQSRTKKSSSNLLVAGIIFIFIAVSVWAVYFYNQNVKLGVQINKNITKIEQMRLENAELQNETSEFLNTQYLEQMAREFNLEKDQSPQYLQIKGQWDLVSHL